MHKPPDLRFCSYLGRRRLSYKHKIVIRQKWQQILLWHGGQLVPKITAQNEYTKLATATCSASQTRRKIIIDNQRGISVIILRWTICCWNRLSRRIIPSDDPPSNFALFILDVHKISKNNLLVVCRQGRVGRKLLLWLLLLGQSEFTPVLKTIYYVH